MKVKNIVLNKVIYSNSNFSSGNIVNLAAYRDLNILYYEFIFRCNSTAYNNGYSAMLSKQVFQQNTNYQVSLNQPIPGGNMDSNRTIVHARFIPYAVITGNGSNVYTNLSYCNSLVITITYFETL